MRPELAVPRRPAPRRHPARQLAPALASPSRPAAADAARPLGCRRPLTRAICLTLLRSLSLLLPSLPPRSRCLGKCHAASPDARVLTRAPRLGSAAAAAAAAMAADGDLPPDWVEKTSQQYAGRKYYFNEKENRTTWTRPEAPGGSLSADF